ncbi:GlxA family transcriptional regulator [Chromohalobacter sp. 48-RD10]|uniref:GlxA family transcriptional regulator n=1 Tax=Chromohalobacter sp. 48-RD10 TaxID=2994063 RepID=UPI0024687920|nr:GlxA family transcriptional regulator [Chromohalobacter sp. 48-RD10]
MTLSIGFFVYPNHQTLDLAGPMSAFGLAGRVDEISPYELHVFSEQGGRLENSVGVEITTRALNECSVDTLIVVGGGHPEKLPDSSFEAVKQAAYRARRVASVCTGAFVLAGAGLLSGRRVTTHWRGALRLQQSYPDIHVEADRIYVRDGHIWTSAGTSAGIDLALALIEEDCGHDISQAVARELVVYYRRPGGQSQFSTLSDLEPDSDGTRLVLDYIRRHLDASLTVDVLSSVACQSPRQFTRIFKRETGETPARAVERLRAEAARWRVEQTLKPVETIACLVGFNDPERMRRAFLRCFGQTPQALRRIASDHRHP